MSETRDWAAVRRRARARVQSMGLAVVPDRDATVAAVELPTTNLFALRGLMVTGRLSAAQSARVRQMLADAEAAEREAAAQNTPNDPYSYPDGAA